MLYVHTYTRNCRSRATTHDSRVSQQRFVTCNIICFVKFISPQVEPVVEILCRRWTRFVFFFFSVFRRGSRFRTVCFAIVVRVSSGMQAVDPKKENGKE